MNRIRNIIFTLLITAIALASCSVRTDPGDFTAAELETIGRTDTIMRVLTIADSLDTAVLRARSLDLSASALLSDEYARLEQMMISTVTHPSQDGVGIAGPQVGLNRRIVVVQRFDKKGEPFEAYPNIRIIWASDSLAYGPEGCLSVPDRRGEVLRSQEIVIEYADLDLLKAGCSGTADPKDNESLPETPQNKTGRYGRNNRAPYGIPVKRDTVKGFTAVIFQHETDHLDGILYIDRI